MFSASETFSGSKMFNSSKDALNESQKNALKKTFREFFHTLFCNIAIFPIHLELRSKYGYTKKAFEELLQSEKDKDARYRQEENEKYHADMEDIKRQKLKIPIGTNTTFFHVRNDKRGDSLCTLDDLLVWEWDCELNSENEYHGNLREREVIGSLQCQLIFEDKIRVILGKSQVTQECKKELLQEIKINLISSAAQFIIQLSNLCDLVEEFEQYSSEQLAERNEFRNLVDTIEGLIGLQYHKEKAPFQKIMNSVFGEDLKFDDLKNKLAKKIEQKWQEGVRPLAWTYYTQVAKLLLWYFKYKAHLPTIMPKQLIGIILLFATNLNIYQRRNNSIDNSFTLSNENRLPISFIIENMEPTENKKTNEEKSSPEPIKNEKTERKRDCCIF